MCRRGGNRFSRSFGHCSLDDWLGDCAWAISDGQGGGLGDSVGLCALGDGSRVWAVSRQLRHYFRSVCDLMDWLDHGTGAISDGEGSWLRDRIRLSIVGESGRVGAVCGKLRDNHGGVARAWLVRNRMGHSRTFGNSDGLLLGDSFSNVLRNHLRMLCRLRLLDHGSGHRAGTVRDGESGRLSDGIGFVVLDDLGWSRAVGY